ncbi:MAG: MobC family plasmid mobilization relaxosome protein [Streptomycetaceae bacterium]|nr:MobC family plasmid mobilization relaxosome protein [Streptomycetaceae bacterium]
MHDQHDEAPTHQRQMTTTPATSAARYPAGPSKGRTNGDASAPGVAEALGHQGVPEEETPVDTAVASLPRAADEAALHRVARRRQRNDVQRKERVDVRYSVDEKNAILAKARSLNIAGAHLVGAAVMAYLEGDLTLPGQRTPVDDYIDELNALREQVAKIGRNVNQIAKRLNSGSPPQAGDTAVLAQTERTLSAVRAAIESIATAMNRTLSAKAA